MLLKAVSLVSRSESDANECGHLLHALTVLSQRSGCPECWPAWSAAIQALGDQAPREVLVLGVLANQESTRPPELCEELDELIMGLLGQDDPEHILITAQAARLADRVRACRPALRRIMRASQLEGAAGLAAVAAGLLAEDDFQSGDWSSAEVMGRRAAGFAKQAQIWLPEVLQVQAVLAAARGQSEALRSACAALDGHGDGATFGRRYAAHAKGLASLAAGDYERALGEMSALKVSADGLSLSGYRAMLLFDLAEAAVRSGRPADAAGRVEAMDRAAAAHLSPRIRFLTRAAAALCEPDAGAGDQFAAALTLPEIDRWPFELGRVKLAYGEHLLNVRQTSEAASQLMGARELFEGLGAESWRARATRSLRQLRLCAEPNSRAFAESLSAREREIALLAATGRTNRQIASELYLSPRTVGAHLHRVFPKLGVSSRAALRDALTGPRVNSLLRSAA